MTKAAISKSSTNNSLTLSKQKLSAALAVQAIMATLDKKVQYRTEVARCKAYVLLSTAAQPASLYTDTEAFQATRNITSGGTHHHPRHDRRWDATCKGQPEDMDHSPVRGLSHTGRQIKRASRANAHIRFSTWLTMVSQTKSWHRLGSINSLWSPSASGAEEWHRWLRQWHRRSHKLIMITRMSMTSFRGTVWVYRHLEKPHSTIF